MDSASLVELLKPFIGEAELPSLLIEQLQSYLDLLVRWNARVNLTAVRDPGQMVSVILANRCRGASVVRRP